MSPIGTLPTLDEEDNYGQLQLPYTIGHKRHISNKLHEFHKTHTQGYHSITLSNKIRGSLQYDFKINT